jgi:hypothetical protein
MCIPLDGYAHTHAYARVREALVAEKLRGSMPMLTYADA